ncbi:MAG: T9SS type B sorting domain-containing protein [Flavobacteriales bacterium]
MVFRRWVIDLAIIFGFLIPIRLIDLCAQQISYIQPDIAAPGMQQYIEILAPHDQPNSFGSDGFYLNDPVDLVRIIHVNPIDSQKVVFGPLVVSWNGRLMSTIFFVNPELNPNSESQDALNPEFIIPFRVMVNGQMSNVQHFYIVKPYPALITSETGVIGSGGIWGKRSKRGAIIFEDVQLSGSHTYSFSTEDSDLTQPGNQGYLPVQLFSMNQIRLTNGARFSVDAVSQHGGPGGGGGGGAFFQSLGEAIAGGDGYTGGQMRNNPGMGTGAAGIGSSGGRSLNGVAGGGGGASGVAGTGGGTGFPFGSSGQGATPTQCNTTNLLSQSGGGSGANRCGNIGYGGAGGGFGSDGYSFTSGQGKSHGNKMLVPFGGGSGGAGGNPNGGQAGFGGGGGGALHLHAPHDLLVNIIQARGAAGGHTGPQSENFYSGAGGGGSGGAIMVSSKTFSRVAQVQLAGGSGGMAEPFMEDTQRGGQGGAGRFRINGMDSLSVTVMPMSASKYNGHATDTTSVAPMRSFMLSGYGNGETIDVYMKAESGKWEQKATLSNYSRRFSIAIDLPCTDSIFYFTTVQRISETSSASQHVPGYVLSPVGSNRIFAPTPPVEVPIDANTPLCLGKDLQLQAIFESPFYYWQGPNGFESFERNPFIEQVNGIHEGEYTLEALVFGCEVNQGKIDVDVKLPPSISLGTDTVICPGMKFTISPGNDFEQYLWQDGNINPIYTVADTGIFHVQIVDRYGCEAESFLQVGLFCEDVFWVPNSFSPNGDYKNEVFKPVGHLGDKEVSMRIFNRWGELIYQEKSKMPQWNGLHKNRLVSQDIYIYELEFEDSRTGRSQQLRGHVTLIR